MHGPDGLCLDMNNEAATVQYIRELRKRAIASGKRHLLLTESYRYYSILQRKQANFTNKRAYSSSEEF